MFKLFIVALLMTSTVFANEATILDIPASELGNFNATESKMYVEMDTGHVFALLTSFRNQERCHWVRRGRYDRNSYECTTYSTTLKELKVPLDSVQVVDREIIFKGESEDVSCGFIKNGRIFKNTIKLILNGNCLVSDRLVKVNGETRSQLIFSVK